MGFTQMMGLPGIAIFLAVALVWVGLFIASLSALMKGRVLAGVGFGVLWLLPVVGGALLMPAVLQAQSRARESCCKGQLSSMGKSMVMYAMDHEQAYPPNLSSLTNSGANHPKIFICKSSGHQPGELAKLDDWTDYVYVAGLKATDSAGCVLAFCPPENHGGRGANVLFVDGASEWVPTAEFVELTNSPAAFFGVSDPDGLREIRKRARILRATKPIER